MVKGDLIHYCDMTNALCQSNIHLNFNFVSFIAAKLIIRIFDLICPQYLAILFVITTTYNRFPLGRFFSSVERGFKSNK